MVLLLSKFVQKGLQYSIVSKNSPFTSFFRIHVNFQVDWASNVFGFGRARGTVCNSPVTNEL